MSKYSSLITNICDSNVNEEAKIKSIQEINDKLESIVSASDYQTFLEITIPNFLKILQEEAINFIAESLEQIPQFLSFLTNKIKDLSNSYESIFENRGNVKCDSLKGDIILNLLNHLYYPLTITLENKPLSLENPAQTQQYTLLPKSFLSLKVLSELPIIVVIVYQLYKPNIHQDVGAMIPNLILYICLEPLKNKQINALTTSNKEIFCEFTTSQVKILSFIAYIIRPFQEPLNQYSTDLVKGIVSLLKYCPPELANMRKEILIALRHIQATHLRNKFIPHLNEILDHKLLLGQSLTCFDTLCPLAYSSLADMVHHLRQNLTLSQLVLALSVFSKNIQDDSLPFSIQNVSCKLLLNLVECVKIRAETENDEKGRSILVKILRVFVLKFKALAKYKIVEITESIKRLMSEKMNLDLKMHEDKTIDDLENLISENKTYSPSHNFTTVFNNTNDIKVLIKTLITGVKTVTWGILTCKVGISSYIHQSKLLLPEEIKLYVGFVKRCLSILVLFTSFNTNSPDPTLKSFFQLMVNSSTCLPFTSNNANNIYSSSNNGYNHNLKEEKENLDTFVGIFLMMNPMSFYEIFVGLAPNLIDVVLKDSNIMIVFNCFLASSTTSPPFTNIILEYLLKNFDDLGCNKEKANLFLKIFKLIFGSVSYISTENETILKHHLSFIITSCMQLALNAKEPFNYFLLLRYLFRFIGNGTHDSLYQEFLPLLPSLLQNLNFFLCSGNCDNDRSSSICVPYNTPTKNSNSNINSVPNQTNSSSSYHNNLNNIRSPGQLSDLFVELCLTVPVRLSSLLPHLPLLMDPLVLALNTSPFSTVKSNGSNIFYSPSDYHNFNLNPNNNGSSLYAHHHSQSLGLVSQGLRTLELCVDNLQPEFLKEHLDPVRGRLTRALWGLLGQTYSFNSNLISSSISSCHSNISSQNASSIATGPNSLSSSGGNSLGFSNPGSLQNSNNNISGSNIHNASNVGTNSAGGNETAITHAAFRLLGKFGGANRKAIKECQELTYYDCLDGRGSFVGIKLVNTNEIIDLPIDPIIDFAYQTLNNNFSDSFERQNAWQVILAFLSINISTEFDDETKIYKLFTHPSFMETPIYSFYAKPKSTNNHTSNDQMARRTHKKALAALFMASAIKELHDQVLPFMINVIHHYTLLAVSRQAGLFAPVYYQSPSLTLADDQIHDNFISDAFQNKSICGRRFWEEMRSDVMIEALVDDIMAHPDKELCKPAVKALVRFINATILIVGSTHRAFQLPIFRYLSDRIVFLCYSPAWYQKNGGCIGINLLIIKSNEQWLLDHHIEYLKALFFVLMDLTNDVANGTIQLAKNVLKKLVTSCTSHLLDSLIRESCTNSVCKELILRISSPVKIVRNEAMDSLKLLSRLTNKSLTELTNPYNSTIYDLIPPKKHLLRHQSVNSQFGLMEAVTFCSGVFFTELMSLCEADDTLLLRLPCYKNLNNDITELKRSALKALTSCQYINQYQEKIFNILFKNLNSSNPDIQHTAFKCLSCYVKKHQVDMESVHHSIRNLLLMLGDYRNLTPNFLTRLLYFARLFPNTFNEKFCEHLMTHMITLLKVLSSKSGIKTHCQELKVCAEILKIFCALPIASSHILDSLCMQILSLDSMFLNEIIIYIRPELYNLIAIYPKETVTIFLTDPNIHQAPYYNFFLTMIKHVEAKSIIDCILKDFVCLERIISEKAIYIETNKDWSLTSNSAESNESNMETDGCRTDDILVCLFVSLKTIYIVSKERHEWIGGLHEIVKSLRSIWKNQNFQNIFAENNAFNNDFWDIPRLLVHVLLTYFKYNYETQKTILFELSLSSNNKYMESMEELKIFIRDDITKYSCSWKRKLFSAFLDIYSDPEWNEYIKASIFQNVLYPLFEDAFKAGQTDQIILMEANENMSKHELGEEKDEKNLFKIFVDVCIQTPQELQQQRSSKHSPQPEKSTTTISPVICNELKIAILKMASLFIQYYTTTCVVPLPANTSADISQTTSSTTLSDNLQTSTASSGATTNNSAINKKQNALLRKLVTFAWPCLQNQVCMDPAVKYNGHLLLAHIVDKFSIHKRIVIQVFHSLLKASSSEARNIIKRALEIIVPAIPKKVENGLTMLTYWTKKILLEEGHTLNQLAHLLQILCTNKEIYYLSRHSLIHLILSAMTKLGFSGNNTTENKKLVVDMAEVIIEWEYKAITDKNQAANIISNIKPELSINDSSSQTLSSTSPVVTANITIEAKPFGSAVGENIINFLIRIACHITEISPAQNNISEYITNKCHSLLLKALGIPDMLNIQLKFSWMDKILTSLENLKTQSSQIATPPIHSTPSPSMTPSNSSSGSSNIVTTPQPQLTQQQLQQQKVSINAVCSLLDTLSYTGLLGKLCGAPKESVASKREKISANIDFPEVHNPQSPRLNRAAGERLNFKQLSKVLNWCLLNSLPSTPSNLQCDLSPNYQLAPSMPENCLPSHGNINNSLLYKAYGIKIGKAVRSFTSRLVKLAPTTHCNAFLTSQHSSILSNTSKITFYPIELEDYYGKITLIIGEYLGSLEKIHGNQLPILHHILSLLSYCCEGNPHFVDRYIPSFMRVFQKIVKDHISSCSMQSSSPPETASSPFSINSSPVTYNDSLIKPRDCIIQCLDLIKNRLIIMSNEMRKNFVGNILIGLIEKSTDTKLIEFIIGLVGEWLQNKDRLVSSIVNQAPSLREKSIILVKLTHCIEKRFNDVQCLKYKFLELILFVYQDEELSSTELTSKLESAYLSGLRCWNPVLRQKFFDHFHKNIGLSVYDRLFYIVSCQNWETLGSHFWIKQCIQLILMLSDQDCYFKNLTPSMTLPSISSVFQEDFYATKLTKDETQTIDNFMSAVIYNNGGNINSNDGAKNFATLCILNNGNMNLNTISANNNQLLEDLISNSSSSNSDLASAEYENFDIEGMIEKINEQPLSFPHATSEHHKPRNINNNDENSRPTSLSCQPGINGLNRLLAKEIKFVMDLQRSKGSLQNAFCVPLINLCHQSSKLSEYLWIQLLPRIWDTLDNEQKRNLSQEFQLFFLSGTHIVQKDCHPSVINVFFEAFSRCRPQVYLQPSIIKYLGKAHNLWYTALLALEEMYNKEEKKEVEGKDQKKESLIILQHSKRKIEDAFEFQPENLDQDKPILTLFQETHDSLSDLYSLLGEYDVMYALWLDKNKYPATAVALNFENWGNYGDAMLTYENLMENVKTDLSTPSITSDAITSNHHSEFRTWETHWVHCLKELNQWDYLNKYASVSSSKHYNPQIVLDCAWKFSDWNAMKEALTAVQKSCPRELAWKVNLCAGYLALSQSDEHHLAMMDRIVEITTGLGVREWKRLPCHTLVVRGCHGPLLRATQKVVELQEAAQLHISLQYHQNSHINQQQAPNNPYQSSQLSSNGDTGSGSMLRYMANSSNQNMSPPPYDNSICNISNISDTTLAPNNNSAFSSPTIANIGTSPNFTEMRSIIKTWKNRFPLISDDLSYWHDIFSWRQQQYQYIINLFDSNSYLGNNPNYLGESNISNNNPLLLSTHSIAQGYIQLAMVARKQKQPYVALDLLNKISIHPSVPISDCFRKVRQTIKCYLEMYYMSIIENKPNNQSLLQIHNVIEETNFKYFTKDMVSEIYSYKGYCYHLLLNQDESDKAFSASIQLQDSHIKAWGLWGECLSQTFWDKITSKSHVKKASFLADINDSNTTNKNQEELDNNDLAYHPRLPYNFNLAKSAITCLLQACRHSSETKVEKYLAQVLWLLKYDDCKCSLAEIVDKYITTIPSFHWLNWVPQLLMSLERKEGSLAGRYIMNIITHFGRTYPQAIFFPVRTSFLSLKMEYKENVVGTPPNNLVTTPTHQNNISHLNTTVASGIDSSTLVDVALNVSNNAEVGNFTLGSFAATSNQSNLDASGQRLMNFVISIENHVPSTPDKEDFLINSVSTINSENTNLVCSSYCSTESLNTMISKSKDDFAPTSTITQNLTCHEGQSEPSQDITNTQISCSVSNGDNKLFDSSVNSQSYMTSGPGFKNAASINNSFNSVGSATSVANASPSPIVWCRRILHVLRELHPTTLYTLEGLVDQLIWFRETWFEELLQYLKQLLNKCYVLSFQEYKLSAQPNILNEFSQQQKFVPYGECSVDQDIVPILAYISSIMNKLLTTFETGIENLANLASKLTNSSTESSIRRAHATLKDPMFKKFKAQFMKDFNFVRQKLNLEDIDRLIVNLRAWIEVLEHKVVNELPNTYFMDDKCSLLNNWLLNDVEIELPGEMKYAKPSQYSIKICKFLPNIRVENKCGFQSCRKVSVRGSNGKTYHYLVLNDNLFLSPIHSYSLKPWEKRNSSHLRTATAQIMSHLNGVFEKHYGTSKRDLSFRLSRMVTISPHMTLVETDESMVSLMDIYENHRRQSPLSHHSQDALSTFYSLLNSLHPPPSSNLLLSAFTSLAFPSNLLSSWVRSALNNSTDAWCFRAALAGEYALQCAFARAFSTFPYGPEQITVCGRELRTCGSPFSAQIDVASLLERELNLIKGGKENNEKLVNPVKLMRLTSNFTNLFSKLLINGPFMCSFKAFYRCLADKKLKLDHFLRAFLNDVPALNMNFDDNSPLQEEDEYDTTTVNENLPGETDINNNSAKNNADINLMAFTETMNLILAAVNSNILELSPLKDDMIEDNVHELINESMKTENLCRINPLLYPWNTSFRLMMLTTLR
ncbi:transformation/transcription domain-associated protein-like [Gordionus sp. m RMFG-2023]|uniref:transformation/transcription domain-associated protein-like n=1 Tax=Gordionus sp. m RMFG-2023 TaxID=3053472 RepID=UPI0031FDEA7D